MLWKRTVTWANLRAAVVGYRFEQCDDPFDRVRRARLRHLPHADQVTPLVTDFVQSLPVPAIVVVIIFAFIYLVLGFFMDQMAIIALTVPVTLPVVEAMGFDPIWFGIIVILLAEIGLITPPLGLNAFVVARAANIRVETVFLGSVPFIIAMLIVTALVFVFPDLSLILTSSVK
jgi:C4-dicarboxylate transporter DctM subunit